ncbi:hypothetical protein [Alteribacter natronophilus]|uniref:hypothetical protein n=1 Tax=Alteribacter natronophilus TaxID=2583810 RepID=UPI00110DAF5D|nr:hypothetical protein [Alteribacter natronophilus]TMW73585.1 hypothetical protein FGB90_04610 [Alteribacter natronophilus]
MKVMEVLLSLPQPELNHILGSAGVYGITSRQSGIETVMRVLSDREDRLNLYMSSGRCEKQILMNMALSHQEFWTYEEIAGAVTDSEKASVDAAVGELKKNGWVFPANGSRLTMPDEVKRTAASCFAAVKEETGLFVPREKQKSYAIVQDLFFFLESAEKEQWKLTGHGVIPRNRIKKLLAGMSVTEAIPDEQWRFGYGRHYTHYPDRFSLMYDFAFSEKWIVEEDVLKTGTAWERGQELSVSAVLGRLFFSWLRQYRRALPVLPLLCRLIGTLLPSPGTALFEEDIVKACSLFTDGYCYDSPDDVIRKRVLAMLVHLHVLHESESGGERLYTLSAGAGEDMLKLVKNFY